MFAVKFLAGEGNVLQFMAQEITVPFANALRRIAIAEVPTMAIDDVVIVENSSSMFDEVLAHRLGLIPLVTDLDTYVMPEACTCHSELGCGKCRVTFTLDIEAGNEVRSVHSGDLRPDPSNPSIRPVSDGVLIAKLAPGQRIRLEAYAALGTGRKHAKWRPVSTCTYKYRPRVQVSRKNCTGCRRCVDVCHAKVFAWEQEEIRVVNLMACDLCMDCVKACPEDMKVYEDRSTLVFNVESLGSLSPETVMTEAAKLLEEKTDRFSEALETLGAEGHAVEEEQQSVA